MPTICQLFEYSRAPVIGGVITGVKVVGHKSVKGYFYPQPVLRKAIQLYEGAPVYICHGDASDKKMRRRSHQEHFGHLQNIHERPGCTGLFGDLHVKQSHRMAGLIVESDGTEFGLSHQVQAVTNDAKTEVMEILEVDSVDLVDNPATTKNLREGIEDMDLQEMAAAQEAQAEQIRTLTEGQGKIVTLLEGLQSKPDAPKAKRISSLEQADGDPAEETPPTFGNTRADFAAGLRGISQGATA